MKATDCLSSEHRLIERMLSALETGAWLLSQEASFQADFFIQAADFIQGFADGCHHRKEEGVLFKCLVENGMQDERSPVAVMLHEHELGRGFTRALREAAERLEAGDYTARPEVIYNARHYAALLREHIDMEDQILFPMANRLIPASQHEAVWFGFQCIEAEEIGESERQNYLRLLASLERAVEGE